MQEQCWQPPPYTHAHTHTRTHRLPKERQTQQRFLCTNWSHCDRVVETEMRCSRGFLKRNVGRRNIIVKRPLNVKYHKGVEIRNHTEKCWDHRLTARTFHHYLRIKSFNFWLKHFYNINVVAHYITAYKQKAYGKLYNQDIHLVANVIPVDKSII